MKDYNHLKIEKKWQSEWEKNKIYKTSDSLEKPKYYILDMFPYPSGEGLHVGHPKGYIATDIISRKKRMEGMNVLHPMGFDAFGLPAENYAIKMKVNPSDAVDKNVARFKKQLEIIGLDYDWSREINTTDPKFYKWTQWIFLKLLEKGLAFESYEPINWCPSCKTGLANEDLEDGKCERCGSEIEQKPMRQWVLKITDYAERLLEDLDQLDWPEHIKESQKNWIGKSKGAQIKFKVITTGKFSSGPRMREDEEPDRSENLSSSSNFIEVFTTRPDTIFGATYAVLAPENKLVTELMDSIENKKEVQDYIKKAGKKKEMDRTAEGKEKTGVELKGIKAINPANNEEISIWIADYVLVSYGTGAVMAVPAHDQRDFEFAKKYDLEIIEVVLGGNINKSAYIEKGILINSGKFDGRDSGEVKKEITEFVGGEWVTKYKLRDWVFSRQRYWGEPIPVLHDGDKIVPVPEKDLPVILPKVKSYEPTGTGESPLAVIDDWVKVKGGMKRETNTMPQWAGSSWYYLRYMDPNNDKALVSKDKEKYWNQIDFYVGGAEHATRHLIYARFWHKFLYDIGVVSTTEPFKKLQSVGLVMGEDGRKMSKRFGNIVNPDEIVKNYGADTLRIYEMFLGPFDQAVAWNTQGIIGPRRFLEKIWKIGQQISQRTVLWEEEKPKGQSFGKSDIELEKLLNKTIKKVSEDIETMNFNTAISAMMILVNEMEKHEIDIKDFKLFLQILAPFAPHMTEEIWSMISVPQGLALGSFKARPFPADSIHLSSWPEWDESKIIDETVKIVIQVNGKARSELVVDKDITEEEVKNQSLKNEKVLPWIKDKEIKRVIYVPGRIINIVI